MTTHYAGHSQRKIANASDARLRLGQLSDATLHRVAVWVAGGLVASGVVVAANNVGPEQHTWWGWLLIGAPLIWLSFLGVAAITFGMLRGVVGVLRWSSSLCSRGDAQASASAASRWARPRVCQFDVPVNGFASAA